MTISQQGLPLAFFRFDAGPQIGGGHAMRCLTLADLLETAGWECRFAVNAEALETVGTLSQISDKCVVMPDHIDGEAPAMAAFIGDEGCRVLIVDHYGRDQTFEMQCRGFAERILVLDDLADRAHDCDILLDQNLGRRPEDYASKIPNNCKLLIGPEYALLKRDFAMLREAALSRHRKSNQVQSILVAFGLTDPDNLTGRALDALLEIGSEIEIVVVLGGVAPHLSDIESAVEALGPNARLLIDAENMAELMAQADLGFGACGTTSWERCCLGLPALATVAADNQSIIGTALEDADAIVPLGWHEDVTLASIAEALQTILDKPERLGQISSAAATICDGKGAMRVLEALGDGG